MASLNLQRNSEVFLSTVDLLNGAAVTAMTPENTWKLEVLAGFAATSSSATQDITSLESGTNPDRSQQRFNTAINPVDWNFQVYLRPTGVVTGAEADGTDAGTTQTGNVKPVADWFTWQSLVSNTKVADGTTEQSVWATGGKLETTNVAAGTGSHSSRTNFSTAVENHLYFKLDNVVYQVSNATVNQATVDAGIEEIATVTWAGFGTTLKELTSTQRDNAISVFGGVLNDGSTVTANSNASEHSVTAHYHPFNQMNVAGTIGTNSFIKNRLSAIEFHHKASATACCRSAGALFKKASTGPSPNSFLSRASAFLSVGVSRKNPVFGPDNELASKYSESLPSIEIFTSSLLLVRPVNLIPPSFAVIPVAVNLPEVRG